LLAEHRTCAMLVPLLLERHLNGLSLMYLRAHEAADFGAPQRDVTTTGPWAVTMPPCPGHRLLRHSLNVHALQQEPRDP
jgi:hypothetical protein